MEDSPKDVKLSAALWKNAMHVEIFTVNPFAENCYIIHDAGEAVLIDPGSSTPAERNQIVRYIEGQGLTLRHHLLTHAHLDHILDCAFFVEHYQVPYLMHAADLPLIERAPQQAMLFGVSMVPPPPPGGFLKEGDTIEVGRATWQVLHCPGHSPGSICFYDAANGFVIVGDVLFKGSIGRTDLWMGSYEQLLTSIRQKLLPLPDDTVVYPGHGPVTTIGEERRLNPFLQEL